MEAPEMTPEEIQEKENMVKGMCICATCPSYKDCSAEGFKKELGFCFVTIGKSECIVEKKGCNCPGCPVFEKMGLKNDYYCISGSEKQQMAIKFANR